MNTNTVSEHKEYAASKGEMDRRLKAFMRLILFLYISACICSIDIIIKHPGASMPALIISAIFLFLMWLNFRKTFINESQKKIYLSEKELILDFKKSKDQYSVKDIESIQIKRTTNKTIREIRVSIAGANNIFINGLEDLEQLKENLISFAPNAAVKEIKEPIDYDHPLFYVILGTAVGALLAVLLRISALYNDYIQILSAGFLLAVGVFWILYKPLKSRYGSRKTLSDDIMGLLFLFIGFIILIGQNLF